MKLKIETNRDPNHPDRCLTAANCKVLTENGDPLGYVQKVTWEVGVKDNIPKLTLEVLNVDMSVEAEDVEVKILGFGPDLKPIEEMSRGELEEALLYEAKQRYLMNFHKNKE